jgi:hypothetical protein
MNTNEAFKSLNEPLENISCQVSELEALFRATAYKFELKQAS